MAYPGTDSDKLAKARERYKLACDADSAQAEREREDLKMYSGLQWPDDMLAARQGQPASNGMPAVPARPALVINKLREPIRQVQNEIRDSDIGIELTPADDFGDLGIMPDDTEVMVREGLVRRIQRESDAQEARNWGGDRADIAGRGYYVVLTRYLPGKTMDQEVYLHRIYNQAGVVLDPARTQPDGSDADWGFVGTWLPLDRYAVEYPELGDGTANPFSETSESDFVGLTESYPGWYQADGDRRAIRIVDYYYTERKARTLHQLEDGRIFWAEELPEGVKSVFERRVVEKTMKFCKIGGGIHELEETDLASPEMPIIEVLGEELHPFDEQRRVEGMIRPARDSQMGFNYMASKQVEVVGLTPIPALHVDPEAIDGYEAWYAVANTRTLPYLPSRTYDDQGRQLKEPHRPAVDPNILPIAQSLAMFDMAIKSTTAVPDPTLGNVDPTLKSGRAIRETVNNARASTSNFLSNRIRSMRREAFVINSYLYAIYGAKPGRLVRTLTGDGKPEAVRIGDPAQQQAQQAQQAQQQKALKVAKLTKDANFNIAIKITKNFDTRRQQEASALGELISAQPELLTWVGDLFFANGDMPNRKQIAERAKVMLAPPIQQMLQQKESGQEIPAAAQQQIAQLTQRLQEAEAVMKGQHEAIQTKAVEQQGRAEIEKTKGILGLEQARLEAEARGTIEREKIEAQERIAAMGDLVKLAIAELQAKQADAHEHAEDIRAQQGMAHEADQSDRDRESQTRMAAHEAAIGDGQADRGEAEAERGRQATAEQAEADRQLAQQQASQSGE